MKKKIGIHYRLVIILLILFLPVSAGADKLICAYLPHIMNEYLDNHYAMRSMNNGIKTQTVSQMIKRLDVMKSLLYESDIIGLKKDLMNIFNTMHAGNCAALNKVYDLLLTRARENELYVKKFLGPDYKLDDSVELNTDLDKRSYPVTQADKEALLSKLVHFQIATALLAGHNLDEAKKQQIHRFELQTQRLSEHNADRLVISFAKAFALALDPHSSYLSPEDMEDFHIQMQLSLEGIGAALSNEDGFTVIEELIPGGGAERTGLLRIKDKIIAVAQEGEKPINVIDMELRVVIKMIGRKKGTKVILTILRQAKQTDRFDVTIVRDKIDLKEREAKITYEERRIGQRGYLLGIIDLPSFYGGEENGRSSYEDVKALLQKAGEKNVDGIILNLSRNGGGLLKEAVRISGLFLDKGGVVAMKDRKNKVNILGNGINPQYPSAGKKSIMSFPMDPHAAVYRGPLIVLTSCMSASASEIVAGALKDYRRAVIVGADHTFGKGSVQTVAELPDGLGGMGITVALYFLPGGASTQKVGVASDIVLPGVFSCESIGESALDYPLVTQTITPFIYKPAGSSVSYPPWRPVDLSLIATLNKKSAARVAESESFLEIIKTGQEIARKKNIVRISDLRKGSEAENTGTTSRADLLQKAKEQDLPYLMEGAGILLDMIEMQSAGTVASSMR
jgi:carboxyl-terminal processing protease